MRQVIKYTLVILGTISVVTLVYQFRLLLLLLVVSLALTAATRPMLAHLGKLRIPGFLAQLLILILILAIIFGYISLIGPVLLAEFEYLINTALIRYNAIYRVWQAGSTWQQMMVTSLPEPGKLVNSLVGVDGELLIPTAINVTQFLAGVISSLFILFAFSMYAAQDQNRFLRLWLTLIPAHQRGPIRTAWLAADQAVGRYLRQQLSLGLVAALLLGLGYGLFGLPYPAGLALLTFFFWFVPLIGFAMIIIAVLLSASGLGWGPVLAASSLTILILMGLKYWIEPKYLHPWRYSNLSIVFWIVILGSLMGLGGFVAGPVVAVATQAVWNQYLQYRLKPGQAQIQLTALQQRYLEATARFAEMDVAHPSPELGSILIRLQHYLSQAEPLAADGFLETTQVESPIRPGE
jgi:predicted PurR-regulated permease PerM